MDSPYVLIVGLLTVYGGLGLAIFTWVRAERVVAPARRRPIASAGDSALSRLTNSAVGAINQRLRGRDLQLLTADRFEQAGLRISTGEFLVICGSSAVAAGLIGFLLGGVGLAVLLALLGGFAPLIWLSMKISKRQATFGDQLPDTLQTIAGNLRAGHSLLRALDGAADDSEAPMSEELRRVVNETRIGRDLLEALADVAVRTKSPDFLWTAQAVETQREVGGNLAEVLENVTETIRERAQLARQVKALSAEGKMSALVLVLLPIAFILLLTVINPIYAQVFFTTFAGWMMLGAVALLLSVGSFWLSRLIKPKY
ncbi:type II secretion system F family protein [Sinomonas sp. R1AF57]|uniref:type II secretion system F family protein n=1 Tax=Sinomonas sp. R1AF57 TaxID=2020377 RepID=UPI000B5EFA82|nr:type II secretion system F family protein [Sinomonas sp. R1AF57]ASN52640.1 type II secretion system protein F [Sinomonas sp. R1AF57]